MVIPPLKGVASAAIEVQPGASRDQEAQAVAVGVELALDPPFPAPELV